MNKYCPNCLAKCSPSEIGGYGCIPCEIIQYSSGVLLDKPDKERQLDWKLEQIFRNINISTEEANGFIKEIKEFIREAHKNAKLAQKQFLISKLEEVEETLELALQSYDFDLVDEAYNKLQAIKLISDE